MLQREFAVVDLTTDVERALLLFVNNNYVISKYFASRGAQNQANSTSTEEHTRWTDVLLSDDHMIVSRSSEPTLYKSELFSKRSRADGLGEAHFSKAYKPFSTVRTSDSIVTL